MDILGSLLTDWLKNALIEGILNNFNGMFDEINSRVGEIATQVGATPVDWNAGVFNMIKNLSDTVILPIAGIVLTFIMCYELIQMILERNNMAEFDTFNIYKWVFKTFVAVYILSNTFSIVVGVFELAQNVVNQSAGVITGDLGIELSVDSLESTLQEMGTGELLVLFAESFILSFAMKALSLCIFVIVFGRMLEIYMTISIAPIPLSTMTNREWGQMGNNYLKSLFALAFQSFLIMVCIAIYAVLLQSIPTAENIRVAVWSCAGYTLLLGFMLFKTGSISKSIFGAS